MKIAKRRRDQRTRRSLHRRLGFLEALEHRRLLAGDLIDVDADVFADVATTQGPSAPTSDLNALSATELALGAGPVAPPQSLPLQQLDEPEGEPEQDLVEFAKRLDAAGVIFFGADWCPACNSQKARFDDGAEFLPFVEVTEFDGSPNQAGEDNQVFQFPTWQFPDPNGGDPTRVVDDLTLDELSALSGVAIPTSEDPSIQPISDQVLQQNTPLHIGVNAYDPNSEQPLTITVSSSNESVVEAEVLQGNRSLVVEVAGRGTMIFELFEQRAPIPTKKIIDTAEAGQFNGNPFHRISESFVIQGGRLTPTPSTINDDFHPDLQHAQAGALSYAKASRFDRTTIDDSGTTQFFITDRATQFLDFNHPVFGQLTEGDDVRKSVQRSITERSTGAAVTGAPEAVMQTVTVINDTENGIVKLTPTGAIGESATVTVTVTDGVNTTEESFLVTVTADISDAPPFLVDDFLFDDANGNPQLATQQNQPIAIPLDAIDVEGDAFEFASSPIANIGTHSISGNILTVTPPVDFVGVMELEVTVQQSDGLAPGEDEQVFRITVTPAQPGVIDLLSSSDTGISSEDDITADATPTIRVNSVESGALVRLLTSAGDQLAQGTAQGNSIDFTIDLQAFGDGPINLKATQEINGEVSPDSVELALLLDTSAPDLGNGPGPQDVLVGNLFSFDASTAEETSSEFVEYTLDAAAPTGMTIDPDTGLVQWTPSPTQRGAFQATVSATDAAGNAGDLTLNITSSGPTDIAFTLTATDINGDDPGRPFVVGETFLINVFVQDISDSPTGVKNAYLDIPLPGTWSRVGNATFGPSFTLDESGQAGALVDELGAGWEGSPQTGQHLLAQIPVSVSDGGDFTLQASDAARNSERFTDGVIDTSEIFYGSLDVMVISPFTAGLDERSVDEDSDNNDLDVLANDEFISGFSGTLLITAFDTLPTKGTAEIVNNDIIYTPDFNENGGDQFTYIITDDMGRGTVTGTVSVSIQPVNDAPQADNDAFVDIPEGSIDNELDVLENDDDVDGDDLTLSAVNSPANGTAVASANNTFVIYTPDVNFDGTETFTYVVTDGKGGFDTGTVTVTVAGENDPPIARNDVASVDEDDSVTISVLDNDDVVDGGETLTVISAVAEVGNAAVVAGTQVSYSPPQDFNGSTTVVYVIDDGTGLEATATVSVTVTPVNDAPVAVDDPETGDISIIADSSDNVIDVLDNDLDVDNDALTIVSVQGFTNGGSATIVNNQLLYTPGAGVTGSESFTYTIEDPSEAQSTATVSITILEFIPSSLAGVVFLDSNGDGVQDAGESGLAGVTVTLTGTPDIGDPVSETTVTAGDGQYSFETLRAGSYTLAETQPDYFSDGIDTVGSQGGTVSTNDTISITLEENVDGEGNNFAERGRTTSFRSIHDLFRSTSRRNIFAAVNVDTGEVSHWTEGPWIAPDTTVTFTAGTGELSVSVEDDGQVFTNSVNVNTATPPTRVGADGAIRVVRLLTLRDFQSPTVSTSATSRVASEVAEGEGEFLPPLPSRSSARDESESAVDAVFANQIGLDDLLRSSR